MPNHQSKSGPFAIDIAISLKRGAGPQPDALINQSLVRLLLAIDNTRSVEKACSMINCSTRSAERQLKRFSDGSGLRLLDYHGWQGTTLSEEAHQCISLYAATQSYVSRIIRDNLPFCPAALPIEWRKDDG